MSFDIFFQPSRYTGAKVAGKNPFTGEPQLFLENEPLTDEELQAVEQVLKQADARGPREYGDYVVQFPDGGRVEVFGRELATGCMIRLWGLTDNLLQFLLDLLNAGKWVMLPAMADEIAITTSNSKVFGIPEGFGRVVVCHSAEELRSLLSRGVAAWDEYRRRVVAGDQGETHRSR